MINKLGELVLFIGFALLLVTMTILDSENYMKQIIVLAIVSIVLIVVGAFMVKI